MRILSLLIITSLLTASGCTSIKSSYLAQPRNAGGLIYFMPKNDLLVTFKVVDVAKANYHAQRGALLSKRKDLLSLRVSVPDAKYLKPIDMEIANIDRQLIALSKPASAVLAAEVASIAVSETYPDTTKSFSLHPGLNHFGKNTIDVTISKRGLLTKAKSKVESQFSEVISNLASTAGAGGARKSGLRAVIMPNDICPIEEKYVLRFKFADLTAPKSILCAGVTFKLDVQKLWTKSVRNGPDCDNQKCENEGGLFYRQPLPYLVNVSEGGQNQLSSTVYSPSESPISMLPIKRSFFADSDTDFVFNDGVPTKFTEVSDGELVSLLKLPADIISAYFAAVGSTFDAFKKADSSEIDSLKKSLELELVKTKVQACSEAIEQGDTDEIIALKCSE